MSILTTFLAWQQSEKYLRAKSSSWSSSLLWISKSAVKSSAPNAAAMNLYLPAVKISLISTRAEVDSICGITFIEFSCKFKSRSCEVKNEQISWAISTESTFVTQKPSINFAVSLFKTSLISVSKSPDSSPFVLTVKVKFSPLASLIFPKNDLTNSRAFYFSCKGTESSRSGTIRLALDRQDLRSILS